MCCHYHLLLDCYRPCADRAKCRQGHSLGVTTYGPRGYQVTKILYLLNHFQLNYILMPVDPMRPILHPALGVCVCVRGLRWGLRWRFALGVCVGGLCWGFALGVCVGGTHSGIHALYKTYYYMQSGNHISAKVMELSANEIYYIYIDAS